MHKIHRHPWLENQLGLDPGHVIIDRDLYDALLREFGNKFQLSAQERANASEGEGVVRFGDREIKIKIVESCGAWHIRPA